MPKCPPVIATWVRLSKSLRAATGTSNCKTSFLSSYRTNRQYTSPSWTSSWSHWAASSLAASDWDARSWMTGGCAWDRRNHTRPATLHRAHHFSDLLWCGASPAFLWALRTAWCARFAPGRWTTSNWYCSMNVNHRESWPLGSGVRRNHWSAEWSVLMMKLRPSRYWREAFSPLRQHCSKSKVGCVTV